MLTPPRQETTYRAEVPSEQVRCNEPQRALRQAADRVPAAHTASLVSATEEDRRGSNAASQLQLGNTAKQDEVPEPSIKDKQRGSLLRAAGSYFAKWKGQGGGAPDVPGWDQLLTSLVGGYLGMLALTGFHKFFYHFAHIDLLIASFGASAVILYGAADSPLATPRAFVGESLNPSLMHAAGKLHCV